MYWSLLSGCKEEEDTAAEVVAEDEVRSHRFSPDTMSHLSNGNTNGSLSATVDSSYFVTLRSLVRSSESERPIFQNGASESIRSSNASFIEMENDILEILCLSYYIRNADFFAYG